MPVGSFFWVEKYHTMLAACAAYHDVGVRGFSAAHSMGTNTNTMAYTDIESVFILHTYKRIPKHATHELYVCTCLVTKLDVPLPSEFHTHNW